MEESPRFKSNARKIFWPIESRELGKFIPISCLMFCVLFNQNVLRVLKDSILISEIGAEVTGFAKVYCVTPCAALFVVIYAKMLNRFSYERIYYYLASFFMGFFIIFSFILYPGAQYFHADPKTLSEMAALHPHLKWYIILVGNWSYIAFYTFAELWPNIFYVLLFWQLANEITTTDEAKRFYTLFSLFGNSSLILVGFLMMNLSSERSFAGYFVSDPNEKTNMVRIATFFISLSTLASCFLVRFLHKNVMTNPSFYRKAKSERTVKEKLGILQSFKYIAGSRYLWLMLICSASFGLSMNLVEAVWKAKINELYPSVASYAEFTGLYILWTGLAIMVMTLVGNNLMRIYNWFVVAVISPVVILVTGIVFFSLVVFNAEISDFFKNWIFISPLALAVAVGAFQNILAKGTKYSIWDTSREMLYIPLDDELKTKGKAAVDVISAKVGKSSSGLIQAIIFTLVPSATFTSISPILMGVFAFVCLIWIYGVREVYLEYRKIE